MISIIAKALGISDLSAALASILVGLALLGGAWGLHEVRASAAITAAREAGKAEERAAWEASVADERRRQDDINNRLSELAMLEQARLRTERDDLARRLEELDHEAAQDTDRDRECLSADSVRRLNAIR